MHLKSNLKSFRSFFLGCLSVALIASCGKIQEKDISNPAPSGEALQFKAIVTFGDSLSDTGNVRYLTEQFAGKTFGIGVLERAIPISPGDGRPGYYAGRFSNGPIWADKFIKALDLEQKDAETCFLRGSDASCNYALGGSTTDQNPSLRVGAVLNDSPANDLEKSLNESIAFLDSDEFKANMPDFTLKVPQKSGMKEMVHSYLTSVQPSQEDLSHTLYVVWGGANDYFATGTPDHTVNKLIDSVQEILDSQPNEDKRYFLIPNLPDLGATPYGRSLDDQGAGLTDTTNKHNDLLKSKFKERITENSKYKDRAVIVFVDVNKTYHNLLNKPADYGFTNTTEQCFADPTTGKLGGYMPGEEVDNDCGNPDKYVFWDNVHPTSRASCYIAKASLDALKDAKLLNDASTADNFSCK